MKFGEKLQELEQSFPPGWHGSALKYDFLKSLIETCDEDCGRNEEEFFRVLSEEVYRVDRTFNAVAMSVLKAHRVLEKRSISCFLRAVPSFRKIRLPNGSVIQASRQNCALLSRVCIEYVKANALALRKICKKHDKIFQNRKGREMVTKFWSDQSGKSSFLHSPLVVELAAVEIATMDSSIAPMESVEFVEVQKHSQEEDGANSPNISNDMFENVDSLVPDALQCPICLDVPFKPVSLACSHVFCQGCLFKACGKGKTLGSPRAILNSVGRDIQCPQCRQTNVFSKSVILKETAKHLQSKHPEYWMERRAEEREYLQALEKEYYRLKEARLRSLKGFHPSYLLYS